ncbi:MAG: D-glycero-beta-D-manno-heptose-7-phosphate kinase [Ignavibacteria bacterium]|nr:D-glycero-beta-D-manno-heptose-7-phosphate kinase [Ignavibacteria bacterium]
MQISRKRLKELLDESSRSRIAVIGDVMLDKYVYGEINRISPEAPVPVVEVKRTEYKLGGAANVANNIKALGAEPVLIGVIGTDYDSHNYLSVMKSLKLSTSGIINDKSRPTTAKTRVIVHSQHVLRIDDEVKTEISKTTEKKILSYLKKNIGGFSSLILQDYNKGVLSKSLISKILELSRKEKKPVYVDPKFDNFFEYKNVTVFKPNRKETGDVLGIKIDGDRSAESAGKLLMSKLKCKYLVLTRGEKGMMLFRKNGSSVNVKTIPTRARHVADVSGAGDTVISTIAVMLAGGAGIEEAVEIANKAAGIVCEEVGIIPIYKEALISSFE